MIVEGMNNRFLRQSAIVKTDVKWITEQIKSLSQEIGMLKLELLSARLNPAAWLNKPWLDSAQAQACSISNLSLLQVRPLLFFALNVSQ